MSEQKKFLLSCLGCLLMWCAMSASVWRPLIWAVPFITAWFLAASSPEIKNKHIFTALANSISAFLIVRPDLTDLLVIRNPVTTNILGPHLAEHTLPVTALAFLTGIAAPKLFSAPIFKSRRFAFSVITAAALMFSLQAATIAPGLFNGMARDSGRGMFSNDSSLYRQIYYRICGGQTIYSSIAENCMLSSGNQEAPPFALGYRYPTVFMLWKYCTQGWGMGVTYLFLIMSYLAMYSVWRTGEHFMSSVQASLAAIMIGPMFILSTSDWLMPMTEYWAMFFVIYSLPFITEKKSEAVCLCLFAAAITREFMLLQALLIIPIVYMEGWSKKYWAYLPLILGFVFLAVNIAAVYSFIPELIPYGIFDPNNGKCSPITLTVSMLQFLSPTYAGWVWIMPAAVIMSLISLRYVPKSLAVMLGCTIIGFTAFACIGGKDTNFYWGIIPLACILPLCGWLPFCIKNKQNEASKPEIKETSEAQLKTRS